MQYKIEIGKEKSSFFIFFVFDANDEVVHAKRETEESTENLKIRRCDELLINPLTKKKTEKSEHHRLYNKRKSQRGTP
jgi:hypothetical protein